MWFQQDGVTPHTARRTLVWLQERFGNRVVSRMLTNVWAPHSPDLNRLDYFLWGLLKDRVYTNKPETKAQLKRTVEREVHAIDQATWTGQQ